MKNKIKKIIFICFVTLLLIQLYQPSRIINYEKVLETDITQVYNVPKEVQTIFKTSCYDCHSNVTMYPWYNYIQPVRFVMDSHIKQGKENLNFNEWGNYSKRKQANKLERITKQIKANEMPLRSYTLIHKNAVLNNLQIQAIVSWIDKIQLENDY